VLIFFSQVGLLARRHFRVFLTYDFSSVRTNRRISSEGHNGVAAPPCATIDNDFRSWWCRKSDFSKDSSNISSEGHDEVSIWEPAELQDLEGMKRIA
jgi:hypothetical protein